MMRKGQKAPKRPKFPTRLEETILKRKNQEFVCTCYGTTVENASIPESTEEEGMMLPPMASGQPEVGTSVTMVGSNVAEAPSEKDKTISQKTSTSLKHCLRMHVMYKTPAQVLHEMDQERDRMTLMAELTDMIEKKTAKMKAEQRKKRLKAKKAKKQQPSWYQELSTTQMHSTEMLGGALMADMEEGGMERTLFLIRSLGLKPQPPRQVVWDVMVNCFTSPVLFLLYLALCLEPRSRPKNKDNEPTYAVRERIVLSCLTHLLIPRTLFDLHYLLPPSEKEVLDINQRVPASFKLKKKRVYESPYLEPQPVLIASHMKTITEGTEKLIDTLESRGEVTVPITAEFNNESLYQQVERRITYEQKKIVHFQTVKEQLRQQAKSSPIKLHRNYAVLQEEENSFYRQLSFLPTLSPTFPNETYRFLRYCTSTETPDTSALAQIQQPRDQTFIPMMSLRHCATSWDSHKQSDVQGAMVPPLTHVIMDENTSPVQIKALEGYFHAYPQIIPYKTPRLKPLTKTNPLASQDYMDYLKKALQYLAKRGNPIAALPDAHLIPHIHKWILKRYRFKMSPNFECNLFRNSNTSFEKGMYKIKLVPRPRRFLCKVQSGLTWDRRMYLQKLARKVKRKFYGQIQTSLVNDARNFWPVMCMKYYDERKFRDTYFAYLPCKQTDVLIH